MQTELMPLPSAHCPRDRFESWCVKCRDEIESELVERYGRLGKSDEDSVRLFEEAFRLITRLARKGVLRERFEGRGVRGFRRWVLVALPKRCCRCYPPPLGPDHSTILAIWKPEFLVCCGSTLAQYFTDCGFNKLCAEQLVEEAAEEVCRACLDVPALLSPKSRFLTSIRDLADRVVDRHGTVGIWPLPAMNADTVTWNGWQQRLLTAKSHAIFGHLRKKWGNLRDDWDDIAQEFLQRIPSKVSRAGQKSPRPDTKKGFATEADFWKWFWTVLDNLCTDRARKIKREAKPAGSFGVSSDDDAAMPVLHSVDPFLNPAGVVEARDTAREFKSALSARGPAFLQQCEPNSRPMAALAIARLCWHCDQDQAATLLYGSVVDRVASLNADLLVDVISFVANKSGKGKATSRSGVFNVFAWIHREQLISDALSKGRFVARLVELRREPLIVEIRRKYRKTHGDAAANDVERVLDDCRTTMFRSNGAWDVDGMPFSTVSDPIGLQVLDIAKQVLHKQLLSVLD